MRRPIKMIKWSKCQQKCLTARQYLYNVYNNFRSHARMKYCDVISPDSYSCGKWSCIPPPAPASHLSTKENIPSSDLSFPSELMIYEGQFLNEVIPLHWRKIMLRIRIATPPVIAVRLRLILLHMRFPFYFLLQWHMFNVDVEWSDQLWL